MTCIIPHLRCLRHELCANIGIANILYHMRNIEVLFLKLLPLQQ